MTELEGLIHFWESFYFQNKSFLEPSMQAHIQNTIKYLSKLNTMIKNGEVKEYPLGEG